MCRGLSFIHSPKIISEWVTSGFPVQYVAAAEAHLEELEDMCHQVDNAVDMATMGGLSVLSKIIKRPSTPELLPAQCLALWVLGTASQNNAKVKESVIKEGLVETIIQSISRNNVTSSRVPAISEEIENGNGTAHLQNQNEESSGNSTSRPGSVAYFRRKALYALSVNAGFSRIKKLTVLFEQAILDSNIPAQERFCDAQGDRAVLDALLKSLETISKSEILEETSSGTRRDHLGVLRKTIGLIHRILSGFQADPGLFSERLIQRWSNSPALCTTVLETLSKSYPIKRDKPASSCDSFFRRKV